MNYFEWFESFLDFILSLFTYISNFFSSFDSGLAVLALAFVSVSVVYLVLDRG